MSINNPKIRFVRKVTLDDVATNYNKITNFSYTDFVYAECKPSGDIDWANARVFRAEDLIEENNIRIVNVLSI